MYLYKILRFILGIICKSIFRINVEGLDNVPKEGRFVLCSNHINILDPIILAIVIRRPIVFMAKKELFENKLLGKLIKGVGGFPVDREGSSLSSMKTSLRTLRNEKILGIFPEGTRVKEVNLDNVKAGVGLISIKGKSPVVPVHIESTYKFLSKVNVSIKKPMCFIDLYDKKLSTDDYKEVSKDIMKSIYGLK